MIFLRPFRLFLAAACTTFGLQQASAVSLAVYAPDGSVFASVSVARQDVDPTFIYTIDNPTLADPAQLNNATGLVASDGDITDIFGVVTFALDNFLGFSAGDPTPYGGFAAILLPKDRGQYDATMYLRADLQQQGYSAIYTPDLEGLPDGGTTGLLLGASIIALSFFGGPPLGKRPKE
jgi:hypothetical protein